MFSIEELNQIRRQGAEWRAKNADRQERKGSYKTLSQIPVETVYTPEHLESADYQYDIGLPGGVSIPARRPPGRLPGPLVDHADVRRFWTA